MNDPQQRWDDQLRTALIEQAASIEAVTAWTPPAEHRRAVRHPWRWLTPLAAAAAVLIIVIGAALTRIAAARDVGPAAPTQLTATVAASTTSTTAGEPSSPTSSSPGRAISATHPPTPVEPAPTAVAPARTTTAPSPSATGSHAPGLPPTPTAPTPSTKSTASTTATPFTPWATATACMRSYTYESVTAEWSGVYGTQFSGLTELAQCGGPDDVNWFPTGKPFPLHLNTGTRIFVLRPGGGSDQTLPLAKFAAYLSHPFTGLFLITGPSTDPATLTEIYHP